MGLLNRLFPARAAAEAPRDVMDERMWNDARARAVAAGVTVTTEKAMTVPVVQDCVQVLSQTVASLPWAIFERADDGSRRPVPQHPLARLLHAPNDETTTAEFFGQMMVDLVTEGDAIFRIEAGEWGPLSRLWRADPVTTLVERLSDRSRRWTVREDDGRAVPLVEGEAWHLRALPLRAGGLRGTSRIEMAREEIGAMLALRDYASRFFANDATPPFVLEHPGKFADDTSRKNYLDAIKKWWGGRRRHSPGLLEHGIKLNRVGVNNNEAQFLETRKDLATAIAQFWRMPPHKVGLLERATNNNIEHQSLEFVQDTVLPWLELIEQSVARFLLLGQQTRFFFEFNVAGLLRGDLKARYEAYAQGRQWGWLSVNDIRRLENMNPVRGGDMYLTPMNMVPAGSSPAEPARRPDAQILGPTGQPVSRIWGGNVVRIEEFRNAA